MNVVKYHELFVFDELEYTVPFFTVPLVTYTAL